MTEIGVVHPGEMGASVAASLGAGGHHVLWASKGRSEATRARAAEAGAQEVDSLEALVARCEVLVSVCPPAAALDLAREVRACGFRGVYVDANAVAPGTVRALAAVVEGDARFIDGGIVGPPARKAGTTRLFLSGEGAVDLAALFAGGPLEAVCIEGPVGAASALKMTYAAWTKGSAALLLAIRALAEAEGVTDALLDEWQRSQPHLGRLSEGAARGNARKAWRFAPEMREIAESFAEAGLPSGFHRAAAEVWERLAEWKDVAEPPEMAQVLERLLRRR